MERIRLVSDPAISEQPLPMIRDIVNLALQRQGKPPVSERTIRYDLERGRQLYSERIVSGFDARMHQLQQLWAKNWRAIGRTPEGPALAPLLAVGIRLVEDMAKLDGSWGAVRESVVDRLDEEYGPSPREMLETGEIDAVEYRAFLRVARRHGTSGQPTLPSAQQIIEAGADAGRADVAEPAEPVKPGTVPRLTNRAPAIRRAPAPGSLPPSMPRPGDDSLRVIEWDPEDES